MHCSVTGHGRCDVGRSVAMVTASPAKHCGVLQREMCIEYHEPGDVRDHLKTTQLCMKRSVMMGDTLGLKVVFL